jgi:hypothetical protein
VFIITTNTFKKMKSFAMRQGFYSNKKTKLRTDIRIRIRGAVIRIHVNETCIRAVIRITAEQHPEKE